MPTPRRPLLAAVPAAAATALALPALAQAAPPPPATSTNPVTRLQQQQALRSYVSSGDYLRDVAAVTAPAKAALQARVAEIAAQRAACAVAGVDGGRAAVRATPGATGLGTVRLTLRADAVRRSGVRLGASGATVAGRAVTLPVSSRSVTASKGALRLAGSITLRRGAKRVVLRSLRVSLTRTRASVTASVGGRRVTVLATVTSSRRATLATTGRASLTAAPLRVTSTGARALRGVRLSGRVGILTVAVPAAPGAAGSPGAPGTPGGSATAPPTTVPGPPVVPTIPAPTPVAPAPAFQPDPTTCGAIPAKPVIVLDIDETALTAYIGTTGGDPGGGAAGQLPELLGQAKALAPVKDLYDTAVSNGVQVDFITGRIPGQRTATEMNLDSEGYTSRLGITFRASTSDDSATYKRDARKALQAQGYTILLNVGDQCSDLFGGQAERAFKLPNTFYFTTDAPTSVDPRCDKLGAGGEVPTS